MSTQPEITTTKDVRDAIVNCFYKAHCADTGLGEGEPLENQYCFKIVKKTFDEQGVDFENPTKEGIIKVITALGEFSKIFRSQDIIKQHQEEIMRLLDKIK